AADAPERTAPPAHPRRDRRAAARRRRFAVALAAGLGLFALLLMLPSGNPPQTPANVAVTPAPESAPANVAATPVSASPAAADSRTELAALRGESARIEEWLRSLRADETPLDGRSLMAATEIEDMIGLVDLQLAAGSDAGADAPALWRTRVELLRELAAVRTTYSLAGTGIAANGTAAAPDFNTL
ncbi:hypothetical protein NM961_23855, partial [Tahibacter sp. P2K]